MVQCNSDTKVTILFQFLLLLKGKKVKKISGKRMTALEEKYLLGVKEDLSESVRLAKDVRLKHSC